MSIGSWLILALALSSQSAWALTDSKVRIQGKVGDFNRDTVTIQTEKGPAKIKRSALGSERLLKPGNPVDVRVELAELLSLNPISK